MKRFVVIITIGAFSLMAAQAQRDFRIALAWNSQGPVVSWTTQSATPAGDLPVLPQFQVFRSFDLTNWLAVGGLLTGQLDQTLSFADTNNPCAFYRVESLIDQESAELNNVNLAEGQLWGADFFGAQLFGANFTQAKLEGTDFRAADLSKANLRGADLTGADLFFVEADDALFDYSVMANADATLGDFSGTSFVGVDLAGADFTSANLADADLYLATTNGADFTGAIFNNTTMPDGSVRGP